MPPHVGPPGQPPAAEPQQPAWGQPPYPTPPPYQGQPQWSQQQSPYGQQYGQPYGQQSPYAQTHWTQAEPDNSPAVAGFILSLTSLGTLVLFFGFLSPINLCVSIAGIFVSRNGIKKVERGETRKNEDLAKWGFWLGIAGTVLSVLVIIAFIAVIASAPEWLEDLEVESEPR